MERKIGESEKTMAAQNEVDTVSSFASALSATRVLVQKAQRGDTHAFDLLVRRFQDAAVGYGAALLGNFHLAEEAAQEAFLELYRTLPALRVPDAFPAYLRLTLRKQCNRITRRKQCLTVPLDTAFHVAHQESVAQTIEDRETHSHLRESVRQLPEAERVVVILFYVGQRSLKDIAAFLDVPVSTVKNRLHSARRKLRERVALTMEETMQQTLANQRPSNDERFRGQIISRLTDTYRQQLWKGQSADRSLVDAARRELWLALNENETDKETLFAGACLLLLINDFAKIPEVMERYLTLPLSPSERFWALWTRIRGLAVCNEISTVVTEQRALMEWLGASPNVLLRLADKEPFAPTTSSDEAVLSDETLPGFALGIVEIGMCFHEAGVFDEWLAMVETTLTGTPKTANNRLWRFYALRHAAHLCALYGHVNKADTFLEAIAQLADEDDDWQALRWPIEALLLKLRRFAGKDDEAASALTAEILRQLNDYWARPDTESGGRIGVLKTLTHNLAAPLTMSGDYALALPLWERVTPEKLFSEWAIFWLAECVWAMTKDRSRALALLSNAAAYRFDSELRDAFLTTASGFADVRDAPDFLAALTPATA